MASKTLVRQLFFIAALCTVPLSAAQATTFKIATISPDGTAWMNRIRAGATEIEERTKGRVQFKFYPGGVMGNDQTKGPGKGTGLGLSMVHGFAEQSEGRFMLHSQQGKGTIAEVWLPAAKVSSQTVNTAPSAQAAPAKTISPLTVLAVDDDALVLMNTVAMLEDLGHTVFEAYSGREALEILRREDSVDLVITDQAMPHMTGIELAKAIKYEWPDIPVLLATGYADRVPGDDFGLPKVTKPFLQNGLADAIVRINPPRRKGDRVVPFRTRSDPTA